MRKEKGHNLFSLQNLHFHPVVFTQTTPGLSVQAATMAALYSSLRLIPLTPFRRLSIKTNRIFMNKDKRLLSSKSSKKQKQNKPL
jgi:hypothetical protein